LQPGSGLCPSSIRRVAKIDSVGSQSRAIDICDGCSSRELWLSSDTRASTAQSGSGSRVSWNAGQSGSLPSRWPQDCMRGLGHDGPRGTLRGAEIVPGGGIAVTAKTSTNWRGHDDVMQIRSFRGSGEPVWVNAYSNACLRLGPDPRRALGPAATSRINRPDT
jgi:hypothetical protein